MALDFRDDDKIRLVSSSTVEWTSSSKLGFHEDECTAETQPIFHTIQMITDETQVVIAKLLISEYPKEWKERLKLSWSVWLEALDAEHAAIGSRADEIVNNNPKEDPFGKGSLFYIQHLTVHPAFRGEKIGVKLLSYTFKNIMRTKYGMAFIIAHPTVAEGTSPKNYKGIKRKLINYYKSIGFSIATNTENTEDTIMEVSLNKIFDSGISRGNMTGD